MGDLKSCNCQAQGLRKLFGFGSPCIGKDDCELLPSAAGSQVCLAFAEPGERGAQGDEAIIAGLVTLGIIQRFEMVDVESQK